MKNENSDGFKFLKTATQQACVRPTHYACGTNVAPSFLGGQRECGYRRRLEDVVQAAGDSKDVLEATFDVRGDSNVLQPSSKVRGDSEDMLQPSSKVLVDSEDLSQTSSKVLVDSETC